MTTAKGNLLLSGDCLEVLKTLKDNSVDAVVTDPPYGLGDEPDIVEVMRDRVDHGYHEVKSKKGFMGKEWDAFVPQPVVWREVFRVLKPGGHILVACGTRTQDWMTASLRFAGFEVRDVIAWVYGSGFPKSLDISKAIDKSNGDPSRAYKFTEWMRSTDISAKQINEITDSFMASHYLSDKSQPGIPTRAHFEALRPFIKIQIPQWVEDLIDRQEAEREKIGEKLMHDATKCRPGFTGPAHSPGYEGEKKVVPITAPATDAAKAWDGWGTALKPAMELWTLARKPLSENTVAANVLKWGTGGLNIDGCRVGTSDKISIHGSKVSSNTFGQVKPCESFQTDGQLLGRFPANLIHDGSDEVVGLFPDSVARPCKAENIGKSGSGEKRGLFGNGSIVQSGYFDTEKSAARFFYCAKASKSERGEGNVHPTVKPLALMRYLCRLITPEWGIILDPFAGSGTTGAAAIAEDFGVILIEREAEYLPIIEKRLNDAENAA